MKLILTLIVLLSHQLFHSQIKNIVLEGGGIRGIAYVGAIKALEEKNMLANIENIAGTSVGGLTAALICVGYTSEELERELTALKFNKFNDGKGIFIGGSNRMIKKYGWYRGEELTNWLNELLYQKTGIEDITFAELQDLSLKNNNYKNLHVTATNLSLQQCQVLSHNTFPNMRIADAVRISASIPLYFTAIFMDSSGNIYNKQPTDISTHVMSDGGFIANYPIHIFDTDYSKDQTIGLRLDSDDQIALKDQNVIAPYEINNLTDYIGAFYNIVIENLNRVNITEEDWNRTISISTCNVGPKIKKLKTDEVNNLTNSGYLSTLNFLDKKAKL
jgi:NTE family protein